MIHSSQAFQYSPYRIYGVNDKKNSKLVRPSSKPRYVRSDNKLSKGTPLNMRFIELYNNQKVGDKTITSLMEQHGFFRGFKDARSPFLTIHDEDTLHLILNDDKINEFAYNHLYMISNFEDIPVSNNDGILRNKSCFRPFNLAINELKILKITSDKIIQTSQGGDLAKNLYYWHKINDYIMEFIASHAKTHKRDTFYYFEEIYQVLQQQLIKKLDLDIIKVPNPTNPTTKHKIKEAITLFNLDDKQISSAYKKITQQTDKVYEGTASESKDYAKLYIVNWQYRQENWFAFIKNTFDLIFIDPLAQPKKPQRCLIS